MAQVSFSDHNLSVRVVVVVVNFSHSHLSSPEPLGQFTSWGEGIQVFSNEGPRPFPREIITK